MNNMKAVKLLLLLLMTIKSYSQNTTQSIWFIHGPTITANPGTVQIFVDSPVSYKSQMYDSLFLTFIKTDIKTYTGVQNFLKINRSLVSPSLKLKAMEYFYEIEDSNGKIVFLLSRNFTTFFQRCSAYIKSNHLDNKLLDAFPYF
jgi:hypothetical protein